MRFHYSAKFAKDAISLFVEEDLVALECWLTQAPESGDVIQGSGGCRKLRWAAKGRGKQGGARVIYFYRSSAGDIHFMRAYAKNKKVDLTPSEIKALKSERFFYE